MISGHIDFVKLKEIWTKPEFNSPRNIFSFNVAAGLLFSSTNREFKIYDATVAKTSLKIASSGLSIFFVIISVCVTFES